jgi:hypothetical protein
MAATLARWQPSPLRAAQASRFPRLRACRKKCRRCAGQTRPVLARAPRLHNCKLASSMFI